MVRMNPDRSNYGHGKLYGECAAPQAIEYAIKQATAKRDRLNREIAWLDALYQRRQSQIEAGTWPPKTRAEET